MMKSRVIVYGEKNDAFVANCAKSKDFDYRFYQPFSNEFHSPRILSIATISLQLLLLDYTNKLSKSDLPTAHRVSFSKPLAIIIHGDGIDQAYVESLQDENILILTIDKLDEFAQLEEIELFFSQQQAMMLAPK